MIYHSESLIDKNTEIDNLEEIIIKQHMIEIIKNISIDELKTFFNIKIEDHCGYLNNQTRYTVSLNIRD